MPNWIDCVCENTKCGASFKRAAYNWRWSQKQGRRLACSRACTLELNKGDGNGNAHPKGPRWQAVKRKLYDERGKICQACGWNRSAPDACHIKDRADGGTDVLSNLILLCPNDHRLFDEGALTQQELAAIRVSMSGYGYDTPMQSLLKEFECI